ncbi:glycoside hydrolase family 31 protein [Myriangium duriaei CBS 260.36]|uniref:alpha-glucosidase n=1 Tax=Myriangium duriaei CBS 260.36 TaxID=1168546 RepID=A0A9P4MDU8_9PEZI|nr:glycoside hydrolase family 31 protein [Myriangium duriaei CBS 260.36]
MAPQLEYVPSGYSLDKSLDSTNGGVSLKAADDRAPFTFTFQVVGARTFRVSFTSETHPLPPHPSISRPQAGVTGLKIDAQHADRSSTLHVGDITATVDWTETPVVSLGWKGSSEKLHEDLPYRSYAVDGQGVVHYSKHDRSALHVGLGEAAAPMDLTARGFKVDAVDCFGYEVYKTSPMYKHIPLLIKATPQGCIAIVSSSYSRGFWSVGQEIDGLWGFFKFLRQDYGGLESYMIVGRNLQEILTSYAELVGFPRLAPRWAYGYLSGGYKYTMGDDPPAHIQLMEFADKLKEHDIPCSGHQMSSGYSISEHPPCVRNVFNWNRHRFPDPEAWIQENHKRGIRLLANIKPFILASHPDYQALESAKGMFTDPASGKTANVRLWSAGGGESDIGGHLDFTNAKTYKFWSDGVRNLRKEGIDGMWLDNNEYTIPNDLTEISLDSTMGHKHIDNKAVGLWGRTMQTELMAKISYEALQDVEPNVRPFCLTRSANIGTLRYACSSWSGDNMTSWEGMKGANALRLTAGFCLLHQYGDDIGGFEGPQPTPELLLRWIQLGIYGSRFAINCFKTSPADNMRGEVIEPWMYPEITPLVRKAIKRRYELMPYIYSLGLESHQFASPPQRWIGWGYEADPEVWSKRLKRGEEQYWFGDALLVGGVYEPGVSEAEVYLPSKNDSDRGYKNLNPPYQYLASGQWTKISSPWKEHIPVLAKIGSAIPVGKSVVTRMPGDTDPAFQNQEEDDYRGIEIYPPEGSTNGTTFSTSWYEDDGLAQKPEIARFTVEYSSSEETVEVRLSARGGDKFAPSWRHVHIILPHGDTRSVTSLTGEAVAEVDDDEAGRLKYRLPAPVAE